MTHDIVVCRTCQKPLRRTRPYDRLFWMCETCNWRVLAGADRLDEVAYTRAAGPGERNRFYPDEWER